jgi:hypothetical protein
MTAWLGLGTVHGPARDVLRWIAFVESGEWPVRVFDSEVWGWGT